MSIGAFSSAGISSVMAMILHLLIKEGPVPEPPPVGTGVRLAPSAAAVVFVAVGTAATVGQLTVGPEEAEALDEPRPAYCVLGGH